MADADGLLGLYVHIPFCSVKCFYCDFAAFSGQKKQVERYLAALGAEAALLPPASVTAARSRSMAPRISPGSPPAPAGSGGW